MVQRRNIRCYNFIYAQNALVKDFLCCLFAEQVPPAPPRPDFDASRAKLQRLGKSEGTMTKQDMQKLKAELEAEYLANFKKTVAMHEVFVQRIANHPTLRTDYGFRVFLEYEENLSVRTKNTKEKVGSPLPPAHSPSLSRLSPLHSLPLLLLLISGALLAAGFIKSVTQTADENLLLSNQRDDDPFFRDEKSYLVQFHNAVRDTHLNAEVACQARRDVGDSILRLELLFQDLATSPPINMKPAEAQLAAKMSKFFSSLYPLEMRIAADEDLKLTDTLMYYTNDSAAAKSLLYRRSRALADYQNANKALDKARAKQRDIATADAHQAETHKRFIDISESARRELEDFKVRRIKYFQKSLVSLAELQIKHAKANIELIRNTLAALQPVNFADIRRTPDSRDDAPVKPQQPLTN
ncbi:unnamed protein product [Schistocephalus solidus]|uniref:Sorting nexin/Vps5-like C-terminal domain-containing protein n=1 Tax=Schistocephalus solidus TaxID=70667 RepID=A0A3P7CDL2_SCHSO|nr:unnamed protein product [Schistocephalus solidus]